MDINTRRGFFGKMAAIAAVFAGGSKLSAQQPAASAAPAQGATPACLAQMRRGGTATCRMGFIIFRGRDRMTGMGKTITFS